MTVCDETYLRPPVWSVGRPARPARDRGAPRRGARARPGRVRRRAAYASPRPTGPPCPPSCVRHRDTPLDGTAPALIYAYGAYEAVDEPEWDPALPSLLDRGVVCVHALIRGGGEGGRRWWLDGSMAHKQHTFDDLVGRGRRAGRDGLVDGARIATRGLSAGGLLQGAVFSQRPGPLARRRRRGAVRRRGDHDARRRRSR